MNKNARNDTLQIIFHILAFSTYSEERLLLFTGLLAIYLMAITVNVIIIYLVYRMPWLHTSMYFFLCNLSTLDVLYISSTLPKLLYIICTGDNSVSYNACLTQLYFFLFFADTESLLISSMAIDRYVAICKPLHYSLIMNKRTCALIAALAWCMSAVNALLLSWLIFDLHFVDINEINNFFCDLKALLSISSDDTTYARRFILVDGTCIGVVPFGITLVSYVSIISTILKIQSSEGRVKAFSSCSSHLALVVLYYGSTLSLYFRNSEEGDLLFSFIFVILVPFFNPLIYSLRNKDILRSLRKVLYCNKTIFCV